MRVLYTVSKERFTVKEKKKRRPVNKIIEKNRYYKKKDRALSNKLKEADRYQTAVIDEYDQEFAQSMPFRNGRERTE